MKHSALCPALGKHLIGDKYYSLKPTRSRTEFLLYKRHKPSVRGINKEEMIHSDSGTETPRRDCTETMSSNRGCKHWQDEKVIGE